MTKKVNPDSWQFKDKIKEIINRHITSEPYEGDTVDRNGIIDGIVDLLKSKEYSLLHHTKPQKR